MLHDISSTPLIQLHHNKGCYEIAIMTKGNTTHI